MEESAVGSCRSQGWDQFYSASSSMMWRRKWAGKPLGLQMVLSSARESNTVPWRGDPEGPYKTGQKHGR